MTENKTHYRLPAACTSRGALAAWGALVMTSASGEPSVMLLPESHTATARILADLLRGTRHTHRTIFNCYDLHRASDHISRLKKYGWPIETRMVVDWLRRDRTILVAEYFLPGRFLLEASCSTVWDFILKTRSHP